jgi:hypothetical protein
MLLYATAILLAFGHYGMAAQLTVPDLTQGARRTTRTTGRSG